MNISSQNKKILIGVGVVGAVAAAYYFANRVSSTGGSSWNGATDPTGNGNVTAPGTVAFNATKVASDLWDELKPTGFASIISGNGDERDNIFRILAKVSQTQFGQVVKAFGKKGYNDFWGGTSFAIWSDITYFSLPYILKKELTPTDYNVLKQKYPNYL